MALILSILFVSQVFLVGYIISFERSRKKSQSLIKKYENKYILKDIPKTVKYENVEPDCQTFYNFIENIKLEKWEAEITEDFSLAKSWMVTLKSHDGKSFMRGRMRKYDDEEVELPWCTIISNGNSLTAPELIKSDMILFLWDYVIEYYDNNNLEISEYYKKSINEINSSLKTLNRTKKLNNILK